jgi:hypothetical protein
VSRIGKSLGLLLTIIIVISSLSIFVGIPFGLAQNGTNVSGIIGSDTTWTQSNSPYSFTGNILVNYGITLTISSGVTVNLNNYYLRVNGSLIIQPSATINMALIGDESIQVNGVLSAIGTPANPIKINGNSRPSGEFLSGTLYSRITFFPSSMGWNQQTNSGSIIENTIINSTEIDVASSAMISGNSFLRGSLTLLGDSPKVVNNNLASSISLINGIGLVSGNEIPLATKNLSPVVSSNTISGGLYIEAGSGIVDDNTISGLTISDAYSSIVSTLVERNMISGSSIGVSCNFQSSYNNKATIENNTITNNAVGVQLGSLSPTIVENNIYGNQMNAKLSGSRDANLINNWWGTTDTQAINQTIYDFKNDFNLGTVNFVPFLTVPNPQATPNPNASIPTPTATPTPTVPEFPLLAILPLCVFLVSVAVLFRYRKTRNQTSYCSSFGTAKN